MVLIIGLARVAALTVVVPYQDMELLGDAPVSGGHQLPGRLIVDHIPSTKWT